MPTTSELKRLFGKMIYALASSYIPTLGSRMTGIPGRPSYPGYSDNRSLLDLCLQLEVDTTRSVFGIGALQKLDKIQKKLERFPESFDEVEEIDELVRFQQELEDQLRDAVSLVEELEEKKLSLHFAWLAHRFHGLTKKTTLLDKESKKWVKFLIKTRTARWKINHMLKGVQAALDKHFLPGSGDLFLQAEARFVEARQTGS